MGVLLGIPIIGVSLMLQLGIVSRLNLLSGCADLILLVVVAWSLQENVKHAWVWAIIAGLLVGIVSALSILPYLIVYLLTTGFALLLRGRIWQAPILAMFATVLFGTIVEQAISYVVLTVLNDVSLPLMQSLNQVFIPSLLLNLFIALPVYGLIRDVANWLYPVELEP